MAITPLTNNGSSRAPDINGNRIAWSVSDSSISLFDGTTTSTLPNLGATLSISPRVLDSGVLWRGYLNGWQLFFDDGNTTTQITTNLGSFTDVRVSGNKVVYRGSPGSFGASDEIYLYDASLGTTLQLTNNSTQDVLPDISGDNVVWRGAGNAIYRYDGVSTTQIASNGTTPYASGDEVVWRSSTGGTATEIHRYDGNTTSVIASSSNTLWLHGFFDGNAVWSAWDGNDWELFRHDGTNTIQITNNSFNDVLDPNSTATSSSHTSTSSIEGSGDNLVWTSHDGNDWEVFYYDGTSVTQVTDNSVDDLYAQISGNTAVWSAGNIFSYTPDPLPPLNNVLIPVANHQDLVFDPTRNLLYITTDDGDLERFDLNTQTLLAPIDVGDVLNGADITPDGSQLVIAEDVPGAGQGFVHLLDLTSQAVSTTAYTLDRNEIGAWDIAVSDNNTAFVTTDFAGSGWTPLRELDLTSGVFTARTDSLGSGFGGEVRQNTRIQRSADRSLLTFTEPNISSGPFFTYDTATDTFANSLTTGTFLRNVAAVNRDGSIVAVDIGNDLVLYDDSLTQLSTIPGLDEGAIFSPVQDVLYVVDDGSDEIVTYDTNTWTEVTRFAVGEDIGSAESSFRYDQVLEITDDGDYLFVRTPSGVRILDTPDFSGAPTVQAATFSLVENSPNGTVVGTVNAIDPNGDPLNYSLTTADPDGDGNEAFAIANTGEITVNDVDDVDFETTPTFNLTVTVDDGQLTATAPITINLTDVVDNSAPTVPAATFSLAENSAVGTVVGTISATDADGDPLTYSLTTADPDGDGNAAFTIANTGEITVNDLDDVDFETTPTFNLSVSVDDGEFTTTAPVTINLIDGIDYPLPISNDLIPVSNHQDLVFDPSRNLLYITTDDGDVERFDLTSQSLLTPIDVGTVLNGADITPDGSQLVIAEDTTTGQGQGFVHLLDLTNNAVTTTAYTLDFNEIGAWDISVGNNGTAFVSTDFAGSGWTPLRELDLATGDFTIQTDALGSGPGGEVRQNTRIQRSADRSFFTFTEPNISSGPIFTYDATTDTFANSITTGASLRNVAAVNRDGSIVAVDVGSDLIIYDETLTQLTTIPGLDDGAIFSPVEDILYVVDDINDDIVAYDTTNWSEITRLAIGEDVGSAASFFSYDQVLEITDDGDFLFVRTPSGIRIIDTPEPFSDPISFADDFDPDIDASLWATVSHGTANTNFVGGTGNSLFFGGGNPSSSGRFITTHALDLTAGGFITFDLVFGTSSNGGENADAGEDVVLEYSINGGTNWTQISLYDTEDYTAWSSLLETIPVAAQTSATQLRWRQVSFSGASFDNWGLDNVAVGDPDTNFAPQGVDTTFTVVENSANGTSVGTVIASDPNPDQVLTYDITSGNAAGAFAIDANNGEITVVDSTPLDGELNPSFNLVVEVTDNGSPALSDSVAVTIDLLGTGTSGINEDFDPNIDASQWSEVGESAVNANFGGSGNALFFTGGSFRDQSRHLTSIGVNVSNGGEIAFDLIFGTSANGGENADAGEDVRLQYSVNNGVSWQTIALYDTEAYTSWTPITEAIPVGAQTESTLFRWQQVSHSGSAFDNWGLDNIDISAF